MCRANKSHHLPLDTGVGTTCGNGAWAARDWERAAQCTQGRRGEGMKPEIFRDRQQAACPEKAFRSSGLHLSPTWPLEMHKRGSSGRACHLGVMAKGWAELWWPCSSSWTAHMEMPWCELHHGLALCSERVSLPSCYHCMKCCTRSFETQKLGKNILEKLFENIICLYLLI